MKRMSNCTAGLLVLALLAGCGEDTPPPALETIASTPLLLSVRGEGELKSAKATPLMVPGSQWAARQLTWMLPEGSLVEKGELIARFSADEGKLELSQALIDLQRNALARAAKQGELQSGQGRVAVDLSQVATELGIARRYADADLDMFARNEVLDAIQNVGYLGAKQDTLQWKRGQSSARGGAELAVLDAQRATFDIKADTQQADLDALELRAPNDGVLMLSANWAGEKPSIGSSLRAGFEFGSLPDTATMEVELSLPQIEAQGVRAGAAIEVFPVGRPDQKITSELSWVASAAKVQGRDSPVKYLSMKAPIPAAAIRDFRLVPGQRLQARVILLSADDTLSVPNVALHNENGKSFVQVREGDDFERREVTLGVRGPARSQVLEGLTAGEQVRLSAGVLLPEAVPVEAEPAEEEPAVNAQASIFLHPTGLGSRRMGVRRSDAPQGDFLRDVSRDSPSPENANRDSRRSYAAKQVQSDDGGAQRSPWA